MRKRALAAILAAAVAMATAGCVSMPNGGPVLPYPTASSGNGQAQLNLQFVPPSPIRGAKPEDIVRGFLTAGASFVGQQQVAREYLTPEASRAWRPGWSAVVFSSGPNVYQGTAAGAGENLSGQPSPSGSASSSPAACKQSKPGSRCTVMVGGTVQARLTNSQAYAVASGTPKGQPYQYDLVMQQDGQWRISAAYNALLLTQTEFEADYQLRNLYFFNPGNLSLFDPGNQHLVPDPVYVPVGATLEDQINGLVKDLINQPPDWLADGATQTAFPKGTIQIGQATVDGGTALVNLGGAMTRASTTVKEQVSAQLLSTLSTAGQGTQGVQSVALSIKGKAFFPDGADGNPVQRSPVTGYLPPTGEASGNDFYYIDSRGELLHQFALSDKPEPVSHVGTGYSSLAVSPDRRYIAVLRDGTVYAGATGDGKLTPRATGGGLTGFTSLSWDSSDTLWAAGPDNVVRMAATTKPSASPVSVEVRAKSPDDTCGSIPGNVKALRVAPDGVRVALILGGQQPTLAFGAIVVKDASGTGQQPKVSINLSPFFVCDSASPVSSLSWYGSDSVITVGQDGATVTRYPVNGGTPTPIPGMAGIKWITARYPTGVIAGADGKLFLGTPPFTGAWSQPLGAGTTPAYPGS